MPYLRLRDYATRANFELCKDLVTILRHPNYSLSVRTLCHNMPQEEGRQHTSNILDTPSLEREARRNGLANLERRGRP